MRPFRDRNPTTIGIVGIAVISAAMAAAFTADELPIISAGDVYHAQFSEVGSLHVGDEVRVAGVSVGTVRDISLQGDRVQVTFKITSGEPLYSRTTAKVGIRTLLGASYLSLAPRGSRRLERGATIPLARTTAPYDVTEAFSELSRVVGDIDQEQLGEALTTLSSIAARTPREFRGALRGVSSLSSNLAARDQQVASLLQGIERVTGTLNAQGDQITKAMADASVLFDSISARREAVHQLLVATTRISTELSGLVGDVRADLRPSLDQLKDVTGLLRRNLAQLDEALRLVPAVTRVYSNALGTGPWFDGYVKVGGG